MDIYDLVSPLDFRYYGADPQAFERLRPYVSEAAFTRYQARVEKALVRGFSDLGWCERTVAEEIGRACDTVTASEVYAEERVTGHAVRALVNCIARRAGAEATRFVHLFATSADVTDTATALRLQELIRDVLLPDLLDLQETLIRLAREYAAVPQIGRTHGRHAVPITFGFAMALYVDRLGGRAKLLENARQNLRGKLSGAVGAYNALSLALPRAAPLFEKLVLGYLGLQPAPGGISSQVVQAEYLTDLGYAAHSCFSVLANLADDLRHLHRSEIGEVLAQYGEEVVGSSTMPHKVNPKDFENVKSMWKAFAPRMTTLLMDQISEHQRDLTNSASQRFLPELFASLDCCVLRLNRALTHLHIDAEALRRNLDLSKGHIVAEPLYVLLALRGYTGAYERVRSLAREARERSESLLELARQDPDIGPRLKDLSSEQMRVLEDPSGYVGQSAERAKAVCARREREGSELRRYLADEKRVLGAVRARWLSGICQHIRDVEEGRVAPGDYCETEGRRDLIGRWIAESKS